MHLTNYIFVREQLENNCCLKFVYKTFSIIFRVTICSDKARKTRYRKAPTRYIFHIKEHKTTLFTTELDESVVKALRVAVLWGLHEPASNNTRSEKYSYLPSYTL